MIAALLGGIGLFLLGMVLMTDGLKQVAGDALRGILSRFVSGPVSAITSGVVVTAIVQSSSATTLTTIGFVSAGLITFSQSVGVILGAHLGTTSTSWLVSLLGFKLDISAVTLPMIGIGVLMRLLLRPPWSHAGMALAGFGLIFVGIDQLQHAMADLATRIDPSQMPDSTFIGRVILMVIGAAMTVVMQSSSAAVATTLAALNSDAIDIEQAIMLVIGQSVGTSVKVIFVSIGASTPVKRTAAAHILFSVITAAVAFVLWWPLLQMVAVLVRPWEPQPGVLALAAFQTSFKLAGMALFVPWLNGYAMLIERLVPERGPALTRHLDAVVASMPSVAIEASVRAMREIARETFDAARSCLTSGRNVDEQLERVRQALVEVRRFLGDIQTQQGESAREYRQHLATLHAMDHLEELVKDCHKIHHMRAVGSDTRLQELATALRDGVAEAARWLTGEGDRPAMDAVSKGIADRRRALRPLILAESARGELSPESALQRLDALLWIDGMGYHAWRIVHHMSDEAESGEG